MHEIVSNDPVAVVRCFYTLVKLVVRHLLHCAFSSKELPMDGIAAGEADGIAGHASRVVGLH